MSRRKTVFSALFLIIALLYEECQGGYVDIRDLFDDDDDDSDEKYGSHEDDFHEWDDWIR